MTKKEKQLQIENLILRLNQVAIKRMQTFDELWELERQTTEMRNELVKLLDYRVEDI